MHNTSWLETWCIFTCIKKIFQWRERKKSWREIYTFPFLFSWWTRKLQYGTGDIFSQLLLKCRKICGENGFFFFKLDFQCSLLNLFSSRYIKYITKFEDVCNMYTSITFTYFGTLLVLIQWQEDMEHHLILIWLENGSD